MPALEEHLLEDENIEMSNELMNTIKFPKNLKHLNNRLPKSQYKEGEQRNNSSERIIILFKKEKELNSK